MASTFREFTTCGLSLSAQNGRLVLDGLDRLPSADAERLVALAKARKPAILVELGYPCPYSDETLAQYKLSHPHLVCCPLTATPWNWPLRTQCESCAVGCDW